MILVTVGSQKFQFDRLLRAVDELIEKGAISEKVFGQIGCSQYIPKHYEYKSFLDREEFAARESECDILITHAGTGAIINAVKKGKKVIAVPRLGRYGEHVDDHQIQIVEQFTSQNLIYGAADTTELEDALRYVREHEFGTYKSSTAALLEDIENYIEQC